MRPDPPAAREGLLEHQAFLRRLARSLVADPHAAEDLAQDAAVIALERPPPGEGSLRGWLARVVRNRAIDTARSERRRQAREQSSLPSRLPRTPEETEEQLQVQRRVFEAVAALDEPYRTAILLRYYHDLGPAAIAVQLGVPISTVKSRLARALARLREQLDDSQPEGGLAWVAVLAGGLGELHRPAVATALTAGGIAMGVKLALSAGLLAILGGWWLLRSTTESPSTNSSDAAQPASMQTADAGVPEELRAPLLADSRSALPQGVSAESAPAKGAEPPAWSLALELRGWSESDMGPIAIDVGLGTGDPLAAMVPAAGSTPKVSESRELASEITLDLAPLFGDAAHRPDRFTVRADHPDFLPAVAGVLVPPELQRADARSGQLRAVVQLERAFAKVSGEVVLQVKAAPDRMRVALFTLEGDHPQQDPSELVRPSAEGRYHLRARAGERHAVVAYVDRPLHDFAPPARPDTRVVHLEEGSTLELEPLVLAEGEVIAGRVRLPDGRWPGPGEFTVERLDRTAWLGLPDLDWWEQRVEVRYSRVQWGEGGAFRITGLGPGRHELVARVRSAKAELPMISLARSRAARLEVEPPATNVDVVLDVVRKEVHVVAGGKPVGDVSVRAHWKAPDGTGGSMGTNTDTQGRVLVELDPSNPLTLTVEDPRWPSQELPVTRERLLDEEPIEIVLDGAGVAPAELTIRPVGEHAPLPPGTLVDFVLYDMDRIPKDELPGRLGSRVYFGNDPTGFVAMSGPNPTPVLSNIEGGWRLTRIQPSKYAVRISARPNLDAPPCFVADSLLEVDLAPGDHAELAWPVEIGGTLRLNLTRIQDLASAYFVDEQGELLPEATFYKDKPTHDSYSYGTAASGPGLYEVQPAMRPGTYILMLNLKDKTQHRVSVQIEAGRVNDVTIEPDDL